MREEFWEILNPFVPVFGALFAINLVLLVLLAFSFLLASPGAATQTVGLMSLVVLSVSLVGTFVVIRKSRQHAGRTPSE